MSDEATTGPDRSLRGFVREKPTRLEAEPWVRKVLERPAKGSAKPPKARTFTGNLSRRPFAITLDPGAMLPEEVHFESRAIAVEAPTEAKRGSRFPIHVQLLVESPAPGTPRTRGFAIPAEGRPIAIDIFPSPNLAIVGDVARATRVYPGKDTDPIRFEARPREEGKAHVVIRVFAENDYLGEVRRDFVIHARARGDSRQTIAPVQVPPKDPESLTLEVALNAARDRFSFRLRSDGQAGAWRHAQVVKVDEIARALRKQMNELARGTARYEGEELAAILRGQGAGIWKLLPEAVRGEISDHVGKAKRLAIVGDDDLLPWELVYATGERRGFLGELFRLTRWRPGAGPPEVIGRGEPCYALAPNAPEAALAEVRHIQALMGAGVEVRTVHDLLRELDGARFGLLHFATHNVPDYDAPNASAIRLNKPFTDAMVGADREGAFAARAPLVFVNACSSAAATLNFTGATGWATCFLRAGAGAFVGSHWEIRNDTAARFSEAFYERFTAGRFIGDAFHDARAAIRTQDDPTWLAYTLFAHPQSVFRGDGP